jgi:hypothetical protein
MFIRTFILRFFEVMFRRIKTETIKKVVHPKIFGEDSQGNELTKFLIT